MLAKNMKTQKHIIMISVLLLWNHSTMHAMYAHFFSDTCTMRTVISVLLGIMTVGASYALIKYMFFQNDDDKGELIFEGDNSSRIQVILSQYIINSLKICGSGKIILRDPFKLAKTNNPPGDYEWTPTTQQFLLNTPKKDNPLSQCKIMINESGCLTMYLLLDEKVAGVLCIPMDALHNIELRDNVLVEEHWCNEGGIEWEDVGKINYFKTIRNERLNIVLNDKSRYMSPTSGGGGSGLRVGFDILKATLYQSSGATLSDDTAYVQCEANDYSQCGIYGYKKLYVYGRDSSKIDVSYISCTERSRPFNINITHCASLFTNGYPSLYKNKKEEECKKTAPLLTTEFEGHHLSLGYSTSWRGSCYDCPG